MPSGLNSMVAQIDGCGIWLMALDHVSWSRLRTSSSIWVRSSVDSRWPAVRGEALVGALEASLLILGELART